MTDPVNPAWALQCAIVAALTPALHGAPIYDDPPADAPYPHVEIGEIALTDAGAALTAVDKGDVTLHVWSRYNGAKEARALLARMRAALDGAALALDGGHGCLSLTPAFETVFIDADGRTRHGVIRFTALIARGE